MQVANKIIVITGAGSGIGQQLTLQLLQKGASVAGVDINPDALVQTGQLAGVGEERFKGYAFDITDKARINCFPQEVLTHFGAVDGLINNAGIIQPFKPVNDLTTEEIQRVMNINFYGTLNLTKAFLPHLLTRSEAHITNISSMGGFLPVPGQVIYGAAKAAVKLLTEGLSAELADTNVRVMVVFPGAIATSIMTNSGLKPTTPANDTSQNAGRIKPFPASDAAEQIIKGIESNKFRLLIGQDARLLDWIYRLNPRYAVDMVQKKMKR